MERCVTPLQVLLSLSPKSGILFLHPPTSPTIFPTLTSANVTSCVHICSSALTLPHCHRRTSRLLMRLSFLLEIHWLLPTRCKSNPSPGLPPAHAGTACFPDAPTPTSYSPQGLCTFSSLTQNILTSILAMVGSFMIQRGLPCSPAFKEAS